MSASGPPPAALQAARAAWPDLEEATRALLTDAAGGAARAQAALATHLVEALRVEAILARAGVPAPACAGPLSIARGHFAPPSTETSSEDAIPADARPAELAEAWFQGTFSSRAQKRRGGVYTRRALVDELLTLAGWGEAEETLWEPAVGAGAFLVAAWERALDAGRDPRALREQILATDVHPFACHAARVALALSAHRRGLPLELAPRVVCRDALAPPADPARRFDLVLGNPPWVRGERIPGALRERYRERFPELGQGNTDLAGYFLACARGRLEASGRVAFVVSQGVLEASSAAGLRALLAPGLEAIASLEWAPRAFPEANVIPALILARASASGEPVRLGGADPEAPRAPLTWTKIARADWRPLTTKRWPAQLGPRDVPLLRHLARCPRPLTANYGIAVRTRVGAARLVADGDLPPADFGDPRPLRDGRDVVAWGAVPVRRWIDYQPAALSDAKREALFAGPKVLVPRIALTPQAWVDESDALFRNTLMHVAGPLEPHACAALINGLPLRYFAFHLLRAGVLASSHRCTLYSRVIADFPLPALLLEDAAAERELGALGRRCAELVAADAAEPELAAAESAVDALLLEAYGLSDAQQKQLRERCAAPVLRRVLVPTRRHDPRRVPSVQAFAPGERYR